MRNEPKPLDRTAALRCYALANMLPVGTVARLDYIKRDGSKSASAGEVTHHNGREGCDTMSVTVADPNKGSRTINLVGIIAVDGTPVV